MSVVKHNQNINLWCIIIVRYPLASHSLVSVQIQSNVSNNSLKHSKTCQDDLLRVNYHVVAAFKIFKGYFP